MAPYGNCCMTRHVSATRPTMSKAKVTRLTVNKMHLTRCSRSVKVKMKGLGFKANSRGHLRVRVTSQVTVRARVTVKMKTALTVNSRMQVMVRVKSQVTIRTISVKMNALLIVNSRV